MAGVRELLLLKLGGSLITDKHRPRRARPGVIARLASEIAEARGRRLLVVGHGSGSFGHVEAAAVGLGKGPVPAGRRGGVVATQRAAHALHRLVVDALQDQGVPAWSAPPSAWMTARSGRPRRVFGEPLRRALDLGLVPVVCGDVVLDEAWSASICSTESALLAATKTLGRHGLRARRAFWLGDTDGVYNAAAETLTTLDSATWRQLRRDVGGSAATDVTGGMRHRVETTLAMARLGVTSWILDGRTPGLLARGFRGKPLPGTRVPAVAGR